MGAPLVATTPDGFSGLQTLDSTRAVIRQAVAERAWRWSAPVRRAGCFVLMYHRIGQPGYPFPHTSVSRFRRHIEWLAANCQVIGLDQLARAVRAPSTARPPVLLTFDDGNRDYHDLAYPILKEFGMPAVVFLVTDYVDHPRLFWWDRLHLAVKHARVDRVSIPWLPERELLLGGPNEDRVIWECERHLKSLPDDVKERAFDELLWMLGDPVLPDVGRQTMNWDEVRATMDLTTYGGHTHTHPLLSKVDSARLEREIQVCRDRIAEETGVGPTVFAYPNGDCPADAKALLGVHGFKTAFSTVEGLNDRRTDWLELRRIAVADFLPTRRMMVKSWM